jgi:hypothetical protein
LKCIYPLRNGFDSFAVLAPVFAPISRSRKSFSCRSPVLERKASLAHTSTRASAKPERVVVTGDCRRSPHGFVRRCERAHALQTIVRIGLQLGVRAACFASSPNRTGQATIGESRTVRHHDCARCRLQRHEQVQCRVSQADRPNPERLSSQSRLEESGLTRDAASLPRSRQRRGAVNSRHACAICTSRFVSGI